MAISQDTGAGRVIVAVSDGHGSRECFRSDVGSRIAVETAIDVCERVAPDLLRRDQESLDDAVSLLARSLTSEWSERVRAHLATCRPSDHELAGVAGGRARHEADPLRAYGATLLCALVLDDRALVLQLGDGDVVAARTGGGVFSVIPPDRSLVGGETTSLCQPEAALLVRYAWHDLGGDPIAFMLLASDGYGNAFAEPDWRTQVGRDFARHLHEHTLDWVAERLPGWLEESAAIGGDDVTVALIAPSESDLHVPNQPVAS